MPLTHTGLSMFSHLLSGVCHAMLLFASYLPCWLPSVPFRTRSASDHLHTPRIGIHAHARAHPHHTSHIRTHARESTKGCAGAGACQATCQWQCACDVTYVGDPRSGVPHRTAHYATNTSTHKHTHNTHKFDIVKGIEAHNIHTIHTNTSTQASTHTRDRSTSRARALCVLYVLYVLYVLHVWSMSVLRRVLCALCVGWYLLELCGLHGRG